MSSCTPRYLLKYCSGQDVKIFALHTKLKSFFGTCKDFDVEERKTVLLIDSYTAFDSCFYYQRIFVCINSCIIYGNWNSLVNGII